MIIEAAIMQNGKMYRGLRHHMIIRQIVQETGIKPVDGEQGFVTDKGEFVSREDAAKIAIECGQIKELKYSSTLLFSEDLY